MRGTTELKLLYLSHKKVKWKASGDAVSILPEGENSEICLITARKPAEEIIITASDDREMVSVTFTVRVRSQVTAVQAELAPREGETLTDADPLNVVNAKENKFQLQAKIFPEDASDKRVTWESLSKHVRIDEAGNVTIAKDTPIGIYEVRVTTADGGMTAIKRIKVNQGVKRVLLLPAKAGLSWDAQHHIVEGHPLDIVPEIYPFNAYNREISVSADDPDSVLLEHLKDKNLIRTSATSGEEMSYYSSIWIRAESTDGGGAFASYEVLVVPEPC